ncbi:MAG: AAA domain-containing protein [Candidatus Thalassarchaeaceae archaeon]|nr:AAA domain-containing protein [Candidatus Thalassarchaeaceae archaeon]MDP6703318.1 AAA domain-containing protein [Candidatus Thalassarchaeaceae archaeon]MDP7004089.1 AAA domain-containing protein [Candidatus Thalassarchaeaceae archaeon]
MSGSEEVLPARFRRSQDHHEAYLRLIRWELDDELAMTEERLRNWSNGKLQANGIALFDLIAKPDGWLFGQRVVRLRNSTGVRFGTHRFRQGDIVMLSRNSPLTEKPIEAIVSERSKNAIRIVLPEAPQGLRRGRWRMDRGANRIAFDRMRDALNSVFEEDGSAPLRELILGSVHDPASTASLIPELGGAKQVRVPIPSDLNSAQRKAAEAAMSSRLTLIQGPPGTGKTHTAVRILEAWAKQDIGTTLAVADSNVAVDNLLEGLLALDVRAVRLGQPVKVREDLREATMDAEMERHPLRKDLLEHLELNEKLARRIRGMRGGKEKGLAHRDLSRGWKEVRRIEAQMRDDILDKAQVLCCTCIGSGHELLDGRKFPRVLVDEATQATEPSTLVPLVRGARQVVLIGDHRQLPPTVISRRSVEGGLRKSLFERTIEMGIEPMMLTTQYRMHPAISNFPNSRFYDNRLEDGISESDRPAPKGLIWPDWDVPIAFLPVGGGEVLSPDGASKENPAEASWVVSLLLGMLSAGDLSERDIGVITPYAGQVRTIRDQMPENLHGVEVRTVDGYQGREKEVIVFSCVRSNKDGNIGFLSDARRLNVALTRAKRGLVVVGDPDTLRCDVNWEAWLNHIRSRNLEAWHLLGTA